jgi:hypothetical protein
MWKDGWATELPPVTRIYLLVEPDGGGEALRTKLSASPLRERLRLVRLDGVKDVSDLHVRDPHAFKAAWEAAIAGAEALPPEPAAARFPDTFRLLDDAQLMTLPDPEWLVDQTIPKLARVTIYAPPNTAKTTLAAGLCMSIATGQPWLGRTVTTRGGCIYVPSEDVSGWKVRLAAAKGAARLSPGATAGVFTFDNGINLLDPVNVSQFVEFVKASGGAFVAVVIDTLSGSMPGANENAIEAMGLAMSHAKQIMSGLGVTVVLLHHTNASGNRERGHTVVRAESDTMIALEPVDDVVRIECNKQRNGPWFPSFEVRVVPREHSVVLRLAKDVVVPTQTLSEHQRRCLLQLRETFTTEGATKAEWLRAATATGMSESTFWRAAKTLEQEHRFVAANGPKFRLTSAGTKAMEALGL